MCCLEYPVVLDSGLDLIDRGKRKVSGGGTKIESLNGFLALE